MNEGAGIRRHGDVCMFSWVEPSWPQPWPQWALQTFSSQWIQALAGFPGELRYQQESWELLTLGCLDLSSKNPMWFQWAAVAISGWLGPFSWESVLHSPSSLSAHSPCFYIQQNISTAFTMPPDRRKITDSSHTRLNWRDLCPNQASNQYDRGSKQCFSVLLLRTAVCPSGSECWADWKVPQVHPTFSDSSFLGPRLTEVTVPGFLAH